MPEEHQPIPEETLLPGTSPQPEPPVPSHDSSQVVLGFIIAFFLDFLILAWGLGLVLNIILMIWMEQLGRQDFARGVRLGLTIVPLLALLVFGACLLTVMVSFH